MATEEHSETNWDELRPQLIKMALEVGPLVVFFITNTQFGIFVGTAWFMGAMVISLVLSWLLLRRIAIMPLVSGILVLIFGGITLLLHDDTFIKWKPTLVYWILGALVLASQWFGRKTIVERMMSAQIALPAPVWKRLNLSWGVFFAALGALNIYVAFYYGLDLDAETRQGIWVNFKVFGLLGITLLFVVVQAFFMTKHMQDKPEGGESTANRPTD